MRLIILLITKGVIFILSCSWINCVFNTTLWIGKFPIKSDNLSGNISIGTSVPRLNDAKINIIKINKNEKKSSWT